MLPVSPETGGHSQRRGKFMNVAKSPLRRGGGIRDTLEVIPKTAVRLTSCKAKGIMDIF